MQNLGDILGELSEEDILDDVVLPPIPGTQQAHQSPATNANPEEPDEDEEDDQKKRMDFAELVMDENDEGKKVLKLGWMDLVVEKEVLGSGAFCKVKKATGYYSEDLSSEVIPYAVKVYNRF
jgi:hypothetical protein